MGLFSRKQKVELEDFCIDFYDKYILDVEIAGVDVGDLYCQTLKRSVAEADARFGDVNEKVFLDEFSLIRFELFGLAWIHQFGDKHAAKQSEFTMHYLGGLNRKDIWDNLVPYNQAIAESSVLGYSGKTRAGRFQITFVNGMRTRLFDDWFGKGFDPTAVARAANRILTDVAWDKGWTVYCILRTLCNRTDCEVNEDGAEVLIAAIRGLYDGARQAMKAVSIEV